MGTLQALTRYGRNTGRHSIWDRAQTEDGEIMTRDESVLLTYRSGKSLRETARIIGIGKESVRSILVEYGEPRRKVGNPTCRRVYDLDESFFSRIDNELSAYWLGFVSADGWVGNQGDLIVHIQADDEHHLHLMRRALNSNAPITYIDNTKSVRFAVYSKRLTDDLRRLGLRHDKSKSQQFPVIPENMHKHFIRGLLDGDGSIKIQKRMKLNPRDKSKRYPTTEYKITFCGTASTMLLINLIISNKCAVNTVTVQRRPSLAVVEWSGLVQCKKILNWLYSDASAALNRKKQLANKILGIA